MSAHGWVQFFADVEDPRTGNRKRYDLTELLVICVCAVISGAEGVVEIAQWGRIKEAWLREFLVLPHGVASHDTFGRVLRLLDPKVFEASLRRWVGQVVGALADTVVAVDGKTVRGSRRTDGTALHLVSAYASAYGLTLGALAVPDKTNEITAIPKLLDTLEIQGAIVSMDAMGCQREIAAKVRQKQADYLLAVKGNQPTLAEAITDFHEHSERVGWKRTPHGYAQTLDKDHGRIETRELWSVADLSWLDRRSDWADLAQILIVRARREVKGQVSTETRFFLTSSTAKPQRLLEAVRSHWRVENDLHWSLDVTFGEDACRVRKDHAATNLALLRRIVLNLIRLQPKGKLSVRRHLKQAAWDDTFRLKLLNLRPRV